MEFLNAPADPMAAICARGYFWKEELQRRDELGIVGVEAVVPRVVRTERKEVAVEE